MNNQNQIPTSNKIILSAKLTIIISSLILLEYVLRDYLRYLSKEYFFIANESDCLSLRRANFYENGGKYLLLYLIYNYTNVYSALFFIFINVLCSYITSLLLQFNLEPKAYIDSNLYPPCVSFNSPHETPIESIMAIFLSFSVLSEAFLQKHRTASRELACKAIGLIALVYISYVKLIQNVIYLNHILLGIGYGYVLYLFFFEILEVKFNDFSQLNYFFEYKAIAILIVINLFILKQYLYIQYLFNEAPIIENLYTKESINLVAINNYSVSLSLFELLGFFLAVIVEYNFILNRNEDIFIRYNIKERNQNGIEMFNNTKNDVSLFRLVLFCLVHFYIQFTPSASTMQWLITPVSSTPLTMWTFIYLLPVLYRIHYGLVLFLGLKWSIRHFGLTNERLFTSSLSDVELKQIFDFSLIDRQFK